MSYYEKYTEYKHKIVNVKHDAHNSKETALSNGDNNDGTNRRSLIPKQSSVRLDRPKSVHVVCHWSRFSLNERGDEIVRPRRISSHLPHETEA